LETGGGLKKAAWFFDDGKPFLIHNVDVIHDLDLGKLYQYHLQNEALATLAIRKRSTSRYLLFNNEMELRGWQNIKTGEVKIAKATIGQLWSFGFSGIHIMSPTIFSLLTETGKFSIINPYLRLAKTELIQGFDHSDSVWIDVGKHESLETARHFLKT
jgi:NDP-sugar pyrophosphorylase family protein